MSLKLCKAPVAIRVYQVRKDLQVLRVPLAPLVPLAQLAHKALSVLLALSAQREKRESVALLVSVVSVEKEENKVLLVQLVSKAKRGMLASVALLDLRAKLEQLDRKGREALLGNEGQRESKVLSVLLVPLDLLAQRATRAMTPIRYIYRRQTTTRSYQGRSGQIQ